ncbi:glycogen debranching protein GlgX [Chitinimonas sp. BJB300]|uniref:glycogen debranching protein GlgX n=1 Tax=Chitinimonas sp. BJB300 TaxID=1559339 RepID=UPI000C0DBE76|nr:glycogen debranching protein GlgX [Chitinimonas sp. BJB300]PHV13390.1 glycogen debranching enzyme GlgX [Chitinimonas sp. BJB300]TSJ89710.1 glycogen debranching protein GlgX [Chitinimonas sp. BJB300]
MVQALGLVAGDPFRLGSHFDGYGVNFAVYALNADLVELCVFDAAGKRELARLPLPGWHAGVWHGYLPGAEPGLIYGYRAYGRFAPEHGQRYNSSKLLCDPYARRLHGRYTNPADYCDHLPGDPSRLDPRNNTIQAVKAVVSDDHFDWGDDRPPAVSWNNTVIYELHVKGFSQLNPAVPAALRGTYAGLAHSASIDWLKWLGVTTVELLPVAACADEGHLLTRDMVNYWGYNSLCFMAVERRYASADDALGEFKTMVKHLHEAGLEVILDVVLNHTGEGGVGGPSFNLRGLDNRTYYRLWPDGHCENWTGCGNTLNVAEPRCLQLVLDTLRFWAVDCHVDGFRFDLAPILARGMFGGFEAWSSFFAAILADPVLCRLKLIAEPWDLGPDGYRVGGFPPGWAEWTDRYRDSVRSFWLHHGVSRGEFARRLTASSDLFERRGRLPWACVNFLTAHDGFNLRDVVSYSNKHNEANGEDNRDGHSHNHSWNCGVEGETDDVEIKAIRTRLRRAMLATLVFSQGTPMLLAGDELGHTQQGNNNAYCQDGPISWLDWEHADQSMADFTARLLSLRRSYPALRHARWLSATGHGGYERADVLWRNAAGVAMTPAEWDGLNAFSLSVELSPEGERQRCLLLINAEAHSTVFQLRPGRWVRVLDTAEPEAGDALFQNQAEVVANAIWLLVLSTDGRVTW